MKARSLARSAKAAAAFGALFLLASLVRAQGGATRPPGGGTVIGGGPVIGGGGGQIIVGPGGGGGTTNNTPTIIAALGVLTGDEAQAAVVVPGQTAAAGGAGTTGVTYQWSISGGKIVGSSTTQAITYIADTAGTVTLNVSITSNGTSATASVVAISPSTAGTIDAPSTATTATGATGATITAKVPAAVSGDRTFLWTVSGDAAITAGARTDSITLRSGTPGLKELTCSVTFIQAGTPPRVLTSVDVKSFLVVTGNGAPVALTVNSGSVATNGTSGTTWPAGSRVDVFANPPPAGQVFDKWTGDIAALGTAALAAELPHAVVTVPTSAVALTATYKPAPAWTPTTVTGFNPQTQTNQQTQATTTVTTALAYYIPTDAKGVVFLLHDTGGTAGEWFARPEQILLVRDLVAEGYGVAALNSVNRNTGAWAAQAVLANNFDALNHSAAIAKFVTDKTITATTPIFFLGMSDGGDAGARYADLLATATPARPVKGAVLYCAAGIEALAVTSKVPQFFALAVNDSNLDTTGLTAARSNSQLLAGRGLATAVANNAASPVLPGRFLALGVNSATFTATDATAIHAALKAASLLDSNNYVKEAPIKDTQREAVRTALPAAYQARLNDVAAELSIAYGEQQFFSDANARVINFLNNRVINAAVPPPGRLVNLSTRTVIPAVGGSFALGFNISAIPGTNDKATLLIRGIGPALKAFGLDSALAAPLLEVFQAGQQNPITTNQGWDKPATGGATAAQITAAAASVGAFPLAANSGDTALLLSLAPGSYTVRLSGINGTIGDVLAEVYDVTKNNTRLTNLSTLATINNEGELLIPGVVVAPGAPGGTTARTLLVRAVGPGLGAFGLGASDLLGDPRITILTTAANGNSQTVATNNNWSQAVAAAGGGAAVNQSAALSAAFPAVGAFPLTNNSADAALVSALAPAAYTLQAGAAPFAVNPNNPNPPAAPNQTGKVLVEVYEVP